MKTGDHRQNEISLKKIYDKPKTKKELTI